MKVRGTRRFTVSIEDDDQFFTVGIKNILCDCFLTRQDLELHFVENVSGEMVDLFITSKDCRLVYPLACSGEKAAVITIFESRRRAVFSGKLCRNYRRSIGRYDNVSTVISVINDVLEDKNDIAHSLMECERCCQRFTPRELEVLECINNELTPYEACLLMNLSPKTFSGHKWMVMRKLGFKRNHELYQWLHQGGLDIVKMVMNSNKA